ncbi:MAG: DNA integrity scanning protein DisA nucleotide-binding domain protein [Acidobacteriota bacterium]|nr:DNA integrity scanning protein DisA nucleotide-binding domain protein [Acidobacteriota bacterium]
MPVPPPRPGISSLHETFLQAALRRFFERASFDVEPVLADAGDGRLAVETAEHDCLLTVRWFGTLCVLRVPPRRPFSVHEVRLARAIGSVLEARYRAIFSPHMMAEERELFRGALEDRYIGAFLEGGHRRDSGDRLADNVAAALEVLRVAALSTYENRPISTGVLLLGEPYEPLIGGRAPAALPPQSFAGSLTAIRSFYRLADGVHTLFLVSTDGALLDIIDVARWARELHPGQAIVDVPCPNTYKSHAQATMNGRDVCVVLSPSQEMKVFAEGAPAFSFHNANWHLLDVRAKYDEWVAAVGEPGLADRLFQTALDLADLREGALFVVLRDADASVGELVAPADRLDTAASRADVVSPSRRDLLYLLTGRSVTDLDPSVLAALASLDGAIVVDRAGRLLAAGAILRHPPSVEVSWLVEGARTTAAIAASRFGPVLKVSEDGIITFFDGERIWDI